MDQEIREKINLVREALGSNAEALQALCDINQELLTMAIDLDHALDEIEEQEIELGEVAHG